MDRIEWERSINLLWHGKLELPEPEDNGLSQFSAAWLPDLRRYITALEHGYREQAKLLRLYRAQTSRGASLGRLIENQWSADAALGYAAMGMRAAEIRPDQGVLALDAMMEAMEHYSLEEARNYEQGLREGAGGTCAGGTCAGGTCAGGTGDGGRSVTAHTNDVSVRVLHNGGTGDPSPTETRDGGDGGQGSGRPTGTADGEMPRVVGPSAEFVPEGGSLNDR